MTYYEAVRVNTVPAGRHGDFAIASNVAWEAAKVLQHDVHLCRIGNRFYVSPGVHEGPGAVDRWRVSPDGTMKEYTPCMI